MSDFNPASVEDPPNDKLQLVAAIILGLAATLTALSAYKAALLDGEALTGYTESTKTLNDANAFNAQGNSVEILDKQLFVQYATASQSGNQELADYLTTLMRPELQKAVEWWQTSEDATTPFDEADDNPYEIKDYEDRADLEKEADAQFAAGSAADEQGDKFELATVLLALTLFFAGIGTLFKKRAVSVALIGVSAVVLAAGALQLVAAL